MDEEEYEDYDDWDDDDPQLYGDEEDGPMQELKEGEVQEGYRSGEQLESFLEGYRSWTRKDGRVVDSNHYAKLYKDEYESHQYSCHSYLAEGRSPDSIVISAIYTQDHEWPFEEQNLYFEYILSDESPWRDLIAKLDLNVVRLEDGTVGWVQVRSLRVNRWMLFHFLKGFRQVWERRRGMKLFTDAKKAGKEGDELYKIFLSSHLFSGTGPLVYEWGGDHKCFRGVPSKELLDRSIKALEEEVFNETYKSDKRYFRGDIDLIRETFGYGGREYQSETFRGRLGEFFTEPKVYGYFLTKPRTERGAASWNYETVYSKIGEISEFITSEEARKEF